MRIVANSKNIIEGGYSEHLRARSSEIDHLFETCVIDGRICVRTIDMIFYAMTKKKHTGVVFATLLLNKLNQVVTVAQVFKQFKFTSEPQFSLEVMMERT